MSGGQLPLLIVGSIALLALLLGFRQLQVSRKLQREIRDLRSLLAAEEPGEALNASFSQNLGQVERQTPTVSTAPRSGSEKYRYIAALADQGVAAGGIAAALQMSTAEVEQLLKLARLKQQGQD